MEFCFTDYYVPNALFYTNRLGLKCFVVIATLNSIVQKVLWPKPLAVSVQVVWPWP